MRVKLINAWFGPDGLFRDPGEYDDLPESFREVLPPSAKVLDDEDVKKPEPAKK